jgi:hypothetical protein
VCALAFLSTVRGLHTRMSWQLDSFFSLVEPRILLVSLVPSSSSSTLDNGSRLVNNAELSKVR